MKHGLSTAALGTPHGPLARGRLVGDGGLLLGHLHGLLAVPLRAHLHQARTQGSLARLAPGDLVVAGMVSAVMGVLIWWLEHDLPYLPEELDRIVEQLTAPGAARMLGHELQEAVW